MRVNQIGFNAEKKNLDSIAAAPGNYGAELVQTAPCFWGLPIFRDYRGFAELLEAYAYPNPVRTLPRQPVEIFLRIIVNTV